MIGSFRLCETGAGKFRRLALDRLRKALDRIGDPRRGTAVTALIDFAGGRAEEALRGLDASLKDDPAQYAPHFWRGETLYSLARYRDAIDAYSASPTRQRRSGRRPSTTGRGPRSSNRSTSAARRS